MNELSTDFVRQPDGSYDTPGRARSVARHSRPPAKLERNPGNGTLGQIQIQKGIGQRFLVRVTSFRRRLLDEDNLAEKFTVDLCRYAGALPCDSAGETEIKVAQQKVGSKEPEFVRVEIFKR